MKTILGILGLGLVAAVAANASMIDTSIIADGVSVEVACHDARNIYDAGRIVSVESGGFTGMTMARLAEQTIAGPRATGTIVVEKDRIRDREEVVIYAGQNFRLDIYMDRSLGEGVYPARLKTVAKNGEQVVEKLNCKVFE